jgi:hypothetical protein
MSATGIEPLADTRFSDGNKKDGFSDRGLIRRFSESPDNFGKNTGRLTKTLDTGCRMD